MRVGAICLGLLLATAMLLPAQVLAKPMVFEREYVYEAGDADSKLSCRAIALEQVKRLLLESLGTYLESETEVKDFALTRDEITCLTAGVVSTEIVGEQWDGKSYVLKARIEADPDQVAQAVHSLKDDRDKRQELEKTRKQARNALREVELLKRQLSAAKTDLERMKKYNEAVKTLTKTDWLEKGIALSQAGKYPEAAGAFTRAIEIDPAYDAAWYNRGVVKGTHMGDWGGALADFERAVALNPSDPFHLANRGLTYLFTGSPEKALQDFNQALKLDPKAVAVYSNRGHLHANQGRLQEALADYNEAIRLAPGTPQNYLDRAEFYAKLGKVNEAVEDYKKALSLAPNHARAHAGLGQVYLQADAVDPAFFHFSKAIELNPNDMMPYHNRGLILTYGKRNPPAAIQDFSRAIEITGGYPAGYYERATNYGFMGKFKEAIADFSRAIELEPDNPAAYYGRGTALIKGGNPAGAVRDLETSAKLAPGNPNSWYNLACAYSLLNKREAALNALSRSIAINPGSKADARGDGDFKNLASDPGFQKLVAD